MYSFNYNITEQDYFDFYKNHLENKKEGKKIVNLYRTIFLVLILTVISLFLTSGADSLLILFELVGLSALYVVMFFTAEKIILRSVRKQIKHLEKKGDRRFTPNGILTFDEQRITEVTEKTEMKVNYTAIEKVYVTANAFYFYFSPIQAFVLPYKSFRSQQELDEFFNWIRGIVGDSKIAYIKK